MFAVNRPFVVPGQGVTTMDVYGAGFGANPSVTLTPAPTTAPTVTPDTDAHFTLDFSGVPSGAYGMAISNGGQLSTNGLTVHVLNQGATLTDLARNWTTPLNGLFVKVTGPAASPLLNETHKILSNTATALTLDLPWSTTPSGAYTYVIYGSGTTDNSSTSGQLQFADAGYARRTPFRAPSSRWRMAARPV